MNDISPRDTFTPPGSGTVTRDYPQAVFAAPYFTQNRLGDMLGSIITDVVNGLLPGLLSDSPLIQDAIDAALRNLAVLRAGDTMTGPLFFTDALPTQDHQAATKLYVDLMLAGVGGGGGIEEVPIYPLNEIWARSLGAWVPISDLLGGGGTPGGDGTVTSITAGLGLTGGTITTSGTIALANTSVAPGAYTNANITVDAQGRLISASSGAAPGPGDGSAGGTVTQINTGTGLTGGPITAAGTISLANTAVTPGTYQGLTIDAQGRITAASNAGFVTSSGVTAISAGTGLAGGTITSTGTLGLSNTGVAAGSYSLASITVDAQGRLTAATSGTAGGTGTVQSISTGTGLTGGPINVSGTIALANTAVTPGSYTLASLTVDQQGRLTAASNGPRQKEIIYSATPPPGPNAQGDLWFNTTTNTLMVYASGNWVPAAATDVSGFLPLVGGAVTGTVTLGLTAPLPTPSAPTFRPASVSMQKDARIYFNAYNDAGGTARYASNGSAAEFFYSDQYTVLGCNMAPSGASGAAVTFQPTWSCDPIGNFIAWHSVIASKAAGPNGGFVGSTYTGGDIVGFWENGNTLWFGNADPSMTPAGVRAWLEAAGNMTIQGNLTENSDARGKRDIADANEGLEAIRRLRPKRFTRWTTPTETELGFVAQDVREALPTAVHTAPDGDTLGVRPTAILAALVNATRELAERVQHLERRLG